MTVLRSGRLERWHDNKGFGFIRFDNQEKDIFIHISAFKSMPRRPVVGDVIHFHLHISDDGKINAINAKIADLAVDKIKKLPANKPKKSQVSRIFFIVAVLIIAVITFNFFGKVTHYRKIESGGSAELISGIKDSNHDLILKHAFEHRLSDIQVEGEGKILKLLSDDTDGNKHQKLIVKLNSGQSILIAHNVDLAQRVEPIQEGDRIAFNGEYQWNEKGGVIHWTHHDPKGIHVAGWLKYDGHLYQ